MRRLTLPSSVMPSAVRRSTPSLHLSTMDDPGEASSQGGTDLNVKFIVKNSSLRVRFFTLI